MKMEHHCKTQCRGHFRHRVLSDLKPGQSAVICDLCGCGGCKRRLLELGLLPGQEILVERVGPFGEPIGIKVRGYHLSLRRGQAQGVCLEDDRHTEGSAQA